MEAARALSDDAVDCFESIFDFKSDEEFYHSLKRIRYNINWMKLFSTMKKEVLEDLTEKWNEMWKEENLTERIMLLDNLREKCKNIETIAWRPKTGDIKLQTLYLDIHLQTLIRDYFESLAAANEEKLMNLKEELTTEWHNLQVHLRKVQNASNELITLCNTIEKCTENNKNILCSLFGEDFKPV